MTHDTSIRPDRRPAPPTIPEDYALTAQWRTGPPDDIIAIEVWGRQSRRDALVRIIDKRGEFEAGTVVAGGTDDVDVTWSAEARASYGTAWLGGQRNSVEAALARRWGAV